MNSPKWYISSIQETETPATKRPKKNNSTSYIVVWNNTIQHLFSKTEVAMKKAGEIGGLMRVFPTKAKAIAFTKTVKPNGNNPVSPDATAKDDEVKETPITGDTKLTAKEIAEDLCKSMVKKNGSRIYGYYKEITSKKMIVAVLDICREREGDDGDTIKQVKKN